MSNCTQVVNVNIQSCYKKRRSKCVCMCVCTFVCVERLNMSPTLNLEGWAGRVDKEEHLKGKESTTESITQISSRTNLEPSFEFLSIPHIIPRKNHTNDVKTLIQTLFSSLRLRLQERIRRPTDCRLDGWTQGRNG